MADSHAPSEATGAPAALFPAAAALFTTARQREPAFTAAVVGELMNRQAGAEKAPMAAVAAQARMPAQEAIPLMVAAAAAPTVRLALAPAVRATTGFRLMAVEVVAAADLAQLLSKAGTVRRMAQAAVQLPMAVPARAALVEAVMWAATGGL